MSFLKGNLKAFNGRIADPARRVHPHSFSANQPVEPYLAKCCRDFRSAGSAWRNEMIGVDGLVSLKRSSGGLALEKSDFRNFD